MMRRANVPGSRSGSVLLAGLLLFGANSCGGGPDTSAADAQIAKLLPDGTAAVVRLVSLDTINQRAAQIEEAGGARDQGTDVRDLLAMAPIPLGDVRLIDGTLPIAIAVTSKRATPPSVALIVPTTDAEKYTKSLSQSGITPVMDGNYAAVPLFGKYEQAKEPSQAMASMMPGDISIHGDLGTLAKNYKLLIDSGLERFVQTIANEVEKSNPGVDGEEIGELYASIARAITASAETIDIGVSYENGTVDIYSTLDVRAGSSMSGWSSPARDMAPLARGMTGKGMFEVLFQMDMQKLGPKYDEIVATAIDIYPDKFQEPMRKLMTAYKDVYDLISGGMVVEGNIFGEDGLKMTAQMMPSNPASLVEKMTSLLQSEPMQAIGLTVKDSKTGEDGETKTSDFLLGFDMGKMAELLGEEAPDPEAVDPAIQALFGDGFSLHTAHRGDRLVMTAGKDRGAVAKKTLAATSGSWSDSVQKTLAHVGDCNPLFVERIDFGALMAAVAQTMGAPKPPAGTAADMLFYGGIRDDQWRFGMSFDVEGMAAMAGSISPR